MGEVDAIVDHGHHDVGPARLQPDGLEAVDVDVGDSGLLVDPVDRLTGVVQAPLLVEVVLPGRVDRELAWVVPTDGDDVRIGGQFPADRGRRDARASYDGGLAAFARLDDRQVVLRDDGAALGGRHVLVEADEDVIFGARRLRRVSSKGPRRSEEARREHDHEQEGVTGSTHQAPSYAGRDEAVTT